MTDAYDHESSIRRLTAAGLDCAPITNLLAPNPALLARLMLLTEYVVCDAELTARQRALLMLLTCRLAAARSLWPLLVPVASAAGLTEADVAAIEAAGDPPGGMDEGEACLWRLAAELLARRAVSDRVFTAAASAFDERALVDATGIVGTFACHAAIANALMPVAERFPAPATMPAAASDPYDGPPRYRTVALEELNLHQRQIVASESWRRIMQIGTGLSGPNGQLMRSPALLGAFYPFAEYCKCDPVLPPKLREVAIITTGRLWGAHYVWSAHGPTALSCGISPDEMESLRLGEAPESFAGRERTVFDACVELHHRGRLSPSTASALAGDFTPVERLDVLAIHGEYVFLSAALNLYRTPAWAGRMADLPYVSSPFEPAG